MGCSGHLDSINFVAFLRFYGMQIGMAEICSGGGASLRIIGILFCLLIVRSFFVFSPLAFFVIMDLLYQFHVL